MSTRERRVTFENYSFFSTELTIRQTAFLQFFSRQRKISIVVNIFSYFQQQRPDLPRLLQQMHAQQLPPGAAMGPHPGIPGLPGLGPGAGLPVPTSASAALLGLGLPPGAAATPGGSAAHPLSMLTKPDLHRGQPDDLKPNGGKLYDVMRLVVCNEKKIYIYIKKEKRKTHFVARIVVSHCLQIRSGKRDSDSKRYSRYKLRRR